MIVIFTFTGSESYIMPHFQVQYVVQYPRVTVCNGSYNHLKACPRTRYFQKITWTFRSIYAL